MNLITAVLQIMAVNYKEKYKEECCPLGYDDAVEME
jgi:hypothetical protein